MYYLKTEASFDAAHFLSGYDGKCKNIHGHRWRIVVTIQGTSLQESGPKKGMLMDFGDLKDAVKSLADFFDHALLLEEGSLRESTVAALMEENFKIITLPFRTTAENFSRYFYDTLTAKGFKPRDVAVYETPTNCAIYDGKED